MASQNYTTAGWDIGGAHLKVAFVEDNTLMVHQWDCPLWKGISELDSLLERNMNLIPQHITQHRVTMTGELVDAFANREQGVKDIINAFSNNAKGVEALYYSQEGYLSASDAVRQADVIASVNWIASATAVAKQIDNAVFIDMGSTTTDVIEISDMGLRLQGTTDFERLKSGELIYTGVVRSCVNTIAHQVLYKNEVVPMMAENFATMADVYRILGQLPDHADLGQTMDGQAKDKQSSLVRLARMLGKDYIEADYDSWLAAAEFLSLQQRARIIEKIIKIQVNQAHANLIIAAGVGRFLVRQIAEQLNYQYQDFAECIVPDGVRFDCRASDCAPAVSMVF